MKVGTEKCQRVDVQLVRLSEELPEARDPRVDDCVGSQIVLIVCEADLGQGSAPELNESLVEFLRSMVELDVG
jgi:hypothetical protein